MSIIDKKVIGYIASYSRTQVLFVRDACLVMGSEKKMQHHISKNVPERKANATLKKIRFGDIVRSMSYGEKIVFDEEAFNRFYTISEIELGAVWVNSKVSPLNDDAPHTGEIGYYEIPAISLTNKCENYSSFPDYI